ncbi:hypothetical protein SDC9_81093 [bioreactor metagenome]|uniref:Uncharacterized protein n=1 Tax=bioreactor metagenome TaxID=1076179 RepID=A0A644Z0V2_9ZZZZ
MMTRTVIRRFMFRISPARILLLKLTEEKPIASDIGKIVIRIPDTDKEKGATY